MSAATTFRWRDGALVARDDCDIAPAAVEAADSWLVTEGRVLALDVHRGRFFTAIPRGRYRQLDPSAFWDAAIAAIPRTGDWFPRVELRSRLGGPELLFRLREAPARHRSIVLSTFHGREPRRSPRVKGPDLEAMLRLRTEAQSGGADEAVLLSPEGWVAEGSTTCLAWWRGDALAIPSPAIARIDSVTLRTVGGTDETVLRANIASLAATPVSLMPDGLEQTMSKDEMANLISYIKKGIDLGQ